MGKRSFREDEGGQAFTIDVMVAFIIIVVVMGVSANAMDLVSFKAQDYSSRFSLDRITIDTADILIKSPGSPDEWEKHGCDLQVTPGLAKIDVQTNKIIPNTLSYKKISRLQEKYDQLMYGKILPNGVNSSLKIYPINNKLKTIIIEDNTPSASAAEIAVANRTVLCDFMYLNILVGMDTHYNPSKQTENCNEWDVCPHSDHKQPDFENRKPGWTCQYFNISINDLNTTDFYILTDPSSVANSAKWGIDKADAPVECGENFVSVPININNKIQSVMGNDTKAVLWFHILKGGDPKDSFNAYIVGVPKGTAPEQVNVDYLNPQPCYFVLQVWY
ncbi:MAG: hypothetical protein HZC47_08890 [Methanobacterium sp.]|uniref:hypothetical protein n=1 Tax=Methanobacterium sp. TaxID=2164 RepID=UPI003D655265|nr:hypothetical protein [Methanobacterium sp.]